MKNFAYWHQGSIDLSQIGFFVTTSEAEAQLEVALSQVRTRCTGLPGHTSRQRRDARTEGSQVQGQLGAQQDAFHDSPLLP